VFDEEAAAGSPGGALGDPVGARVEVTVGVVGVVAEVVFVADGVGPEVDVEGAGLPLTAVTVDASLSSGSTVTVLRKLGPPSAASTMVTVTDLPRGIVPSQQCTLPA
jgi:hypothetical protein